MGTREAGLLKQRHGRGVAEGSERQLQRANAASGGVGDLRQPDRLAGVTVDKSFGAANLLWRGGAVVIRDRIAVAVRLPMQQRMDDELLEASGDGRMAERRLRFGKLRGNYIDGAAKHGATAVS